MPYVPSNKTVPPAEDRDVLNIAVERLAHQVAASITSNFSLITSYKRVFSGVADSLRQLVQKTDVNRPFAGPIFMLAKEIFNVALKYNYEGAYLGELNYSITRLIQRVPQIKVESGEWKEPDELRYWLYACTVEALTCTATEWQNSGLGIGGVFEDVKDEYKRRVNTAYEAAQIIKSGDCYNTPYYTRLVEVVTEDDRCLGHQEIMLRRSKDSLSEDVVPYQIVVRQKK